MCHQYRRLALIIVVALITTLAGCGAGQRDDAHEVMLAEVSAMPLHVQHAPHLVRDAYRFAATHADVLEQIPCYCGCGAMGHLSNYACFWQGDGQVDEHALNCGICVDIAEDVRQGLARGQPLVDIRAQIDADYSRFGPATETAPVTTAAASNTNR